MLNVDANVNCKCQVRSVQISFDIVKFQNIFTDLKLCYIIIRVRKIRLTHRFYTDFQYFLEKRRKPFYGIQNYFEQRVYNVSAQFSHFSSIAPSPQTATQYFSIVRRFCSPSRHHQYLPCTHRPILLDQLGISMLFSQQKLLSRRSSKDLLSNFEFSISVLIFSEIGKS